MSTNQMAPPELSALPGAAILLRLRRLVLCVIVVALVYALMTQGSRGYCADLGEAESPSGDGSVSAVSSCVSLDLRPSPLVFIALAVVVFVAMGRVLRSALTVPRAIQIIDRAAIVAVSVVALSWLISVVWFALIPIETWNGGGSFWFPFPFGAVDLGSSTTG